MMDLRFAGEKTPLLANESRSKGHVSISGSDTSIATADIPDSGTSTSLVKDDSPIKEAEISKTEADSPNNASLSSLSLSSERGSVASFYNDSPTPASTDTSLQSLDSKTPEKDDSEQQNADAAGGDVKQADSGKTAQDVLFADGEPRPTKPYSQSIIRRMSNRMAKRRKETGNIEKDPEVVYQHMQRVAIKVTFSRVLDIDTMEQQFDAEVYIQAKWTESGLAGKSEEELDAITFPECWNPKLVILNTCSGFDKDTLCMMIRYEEGEVYPVVTYMWSVKSIFLETMELEHFPFDTQELSIALSSERPQHEIDLVQDKDNVSCVNLNAVRDTQEWKSFRHVEFIQDFRSSDVFNSTTHPVLVASCHVQRRLGFYLWNFFIIVFLIMALSLTILSIDPTTTDRLGVTMTLFLTCVAFKLVVKASLPTISYLTYMDVYMIFTLIYLAGQAAENAIMSHLARFRKREKVIIYDEIAQSILIALLCLFHAAFLVYIQLTAFRRRRSMNDKDREFVLQLSKSQNEKPVSSSTTAIPLHSATTNEKDESTLTPDATDAPDAPDTPQLDKKGSDAMIGVGDASNNRYRQRRYR